jgi:hypothetical protein
MVVPLVVPSTRTATPLVIALTEVEFVPFWYVVEDDSTTVTLTPADVVSVKLDVDTLSTVPAAPPDAGPDRALEPGPPERPAVAGLEMGLEEAGVAVPLLLAQAARIVVAASMSTR